MGAKNKKVLIAGGTSSLAREIIECALIEDYQVYCTTRRNQIDVNGKINYINLNLDSIASIGDFLGRIEQEKFERIIVLLGAVTNRDYFDMQYREIVEYYQTYLINSNYLFSKLVSLLETDGNILVMSSRAASNPSFDAHYSAVKSGVEAFVRSSVRILSGTQSAVTVSSGLIVNSTMYIGMDPIIRESHLQRAHGQLLQLEEAGRLIWGLSPNKTIDFSGKTMRIGPEY